MKKSLKNLAMKCKISNLEVLGFFFNNFYIPVFMDRTSVMFEKYSSRT